MPDREDIIHYKGILSFETIGVLLNELKNKKTAYGIHVSTYKRVISMMIETLENIYKYSDQYMDLVLDQPEYAPSFDLYRHGSRYIILTENPIKKHHVLPLKEKIDDINRLDHREVRARYRDTITDGQFTDKGGAGLGFLEMAKVTRNKLEYSFQDIDGNFTLFHLVLFMSCSKLE